MAASKFAVEVLITLKDLASGTLGRVGQSFASLGRSAGSALSGIYARVAALVASLLGLHQAVAALGQAGSVEALEGQFTGLLGSVEAARAKLAELEQVFGLRQVEAARNLYAQLAAFGLRPTNEQLRSLIGFNARAGQGQENLSGIVAQLGQAWGKQKLQYEDVLILLERGVPVWDLLSQATGQTVGQLTEMASKGELGRGAITALIAAMGQVADGASAARLSTWGGLLESIGALWRRFQADLANGGAFDYAKGKLTELGDVLEWAIASGAARRWGEEVGAAVTSIGAWFESATRFVGGFVAASQVAFNLFTSAIRGAAAAIAYLAERTASVLATLVGAIPGLGRIAEQLRNVQDAARSVAEQNAQAMRQDADDAAAAAARLGQAIEQAAGSGSAGWAEAVARAREYIQAQQAAQQATRGAAAAGREAAQAHQAGAAAALADANALKATKAAADAAKKGLEDVASARAALLTAQQRAAGVPEVSANWADASTKASQAAAALSDKQPDQALARIAEAYRILEQAATAGGPVGTIEVLRGELDQLTAAAQKALGATSQVLGGPGGAGTGAGAGAGGLDDAARREQLADAYRAAGLEPPQDTGAAGGAATPSTPPTPAGAATPPTTPTPAGAPAGPTAPGARAGQEQAARVPVVPVLDVAATALMAQVVGETLARAIRERLAAEQFRVVVQADVQVAGGGSLATDELGREAAKRG